MKKIQMKWANIERQYFNIVLAVVLIGGLVFTAGFGLCLYFARNNAESMTEKSVMASLDLLHTHIDQRLVAYENLLLACYWAENRDRAIMFAKDFSSEDDVQLCTELLAGLSSNICGVALGLEPPYYGLPKGRYGFCMYSTNSSGQTQSLRLDNIQDYRKLEWYSRPMRLGKSCWIEPYRTFRTGNVITSFALPLIDEKLHPTGILIIDIDVKGFIEQCKAILPYKDAKIYILDKDNKYITNADDSKLLKSMEKSRFNASLLNHIKTSDRGTVTMRDGRTKSLLCYDKIPRTGWTVCIECPYEDIYGASDELGHKMIIISIISILLLAFCFIFLYRRLMKTTMAKATIESDLNVAQKVQLSILPKKYPAFPDRDDIDVYGFLKTAKSVGGDLYDYIVRDNKLFFCIGDVSGKGVPASLYMFVVTTCFHNNAQTIDSASLLMSSLNKVLLSENKDYTFCTFFIGILDMKTGLLEYCNAGHEAPIITSCDIDGNTSVRFLDVDSNIALGVLDDFPYHEQSCVLQPGDTIFLFTDGVTESENSHKDLFGIDATLEAVRQVCEGDLPLIEEVNKIYDKIQHHSLGIEQSDDITMLMVKYKGRTVTLENKMEQLTRLTVFAEEICDGLPIDDKCRNDFLVAIDEIGANICMYAYPQDEVNTFTVSFRQDDDELAFMFEDTGVPFDPTKTADVNLDVPAEERLIGGLGIFMTRQIMDKVEYQRVGNRNLLTIAKKKTHNK